MFLGFLFVLFVAASAGPATKCGDYGILPNADIIVQGVPCEEAPCTIYPGKNVTVSLYFLAPEFMDVFEPELIAHLDEEVKFDLGQTDGCESVVNTLCPIIDHDAVEYILDITVPEDIPVMDFNATFRILETDEDHEEFEGIVCFNILLSVFNNNNTNVVNEGECTK